MQKVIEYMLSDFERGRLTRRQLAVALAALVSGAQAAPKLEGLHAVTLNHVTVRVPDIQRTSRFYQEFFGMPLKQHSEKTHILGVGKNFFGIEQKGTPLNSIISHSTPWREARRYEYAPFIRTDSGATDDGSGMCFWINYFPGAARDSEVERGYGAPEN